MEVTEGFAVIEATTLAVSVEIVAQTPCAVQLAHKVGLTCASVRPGGAPAHVSPPAKPAAAPRPRIGAAMLTSPRVGNWATAAFEIHARAAYRLQGVTLAAVRGTVHTSKYRPSRGTS